MRCRRIERHEHSERFDDRPYLMFKNGTEIQTLPEELREDLQLDELRFRSAAP
jgi:hypothetical protein